MRADDSVGPLPQHVPHIVAPAASHNASHSRPHTSRHASSHDRRPVNLPNIGSNKPARFVLPGEILQAQLD
jgi:hypothetical protein